MLSAEGFLDHTGEEAIVLSEDRADELSAIVCLDGDRRGIKALSTEVIQAQGNELGRVEGGELIGITDESSASQDVFDAVLELRQDAADHLSVDVRDIIEILDVQLPVS